MSQKEMAYKIEELQNEAMKIHSLQVALFEAIYNGNNALTTYEWAFIALLDLTFMVRNKLEELSNTAFENLKKDVKENA